MRPFWATVSTCVLSGSTRLCSVRVWEPSWQAGKSGRLLNHELFRCEHLRLLCHGVFSMPTTNYLHVLHRASFSKSQNVSKCCIVYLLLILNIAQTTNCSILQGPSRSSVSRYAAGYDTASGLFQLRTLYEFSSASMASSWLMIWN